MYQVLSGIRVLDLTAIVSGPYATQFLGDFGAEVIKIEPPAGDLFRAARPGRSPHMGAGYMNLHRNKKSVVLDLKTEAGKAVFRKLATEAQVVVHNMRPKAAAKLGVDFDSLRALNPSIVCCVAPGYGQAGRHADEPAYDDIIQAASGLAHLNANAQGEPRFLPTIICDKVGGLHLALAVLAGVTHQARTGQGCLIEAPMFESMVSFLMAEQLAGRSFVPPLGGTGYDRLLSPHRRPFGTKDGFIGVLPYSTTHWQRFLTYVGREDIVSADWVCDPVKRSENVGRLYEIIAEHMPTRTTAEWLDALRTLDIPCAPVNRLEDLLEDGHLTDVGFFPESDHPSEGRIVSVRTPFTVVGVDSAPDRHAPELGEHTEEFTG